ncbi:uncharacterized protein VTP21DRAFT_7246 [Calcarisporiella thermophila]|uniref:uncharacterized protein n=1 Tax=Calcarisporiella thermophila TaxID=911321 RepID=UPI0037448348
MKVSTLYISSALALVATSNAAPVQKRTFGLIGALIREKVRFIERIFGKPYPIITATGYLTSTPCYSTTITYRETNSYGSVIATTTTVVITPTVTTIQPTGPSTSPTGTGPSTSPTDTGPSTSPTGTGPSTSPTDTGPSTSPTGTGPSTSPTGTDPSTSPTDTSSYSTTPTVTVTYTPNPSTVTRYVTYTRPCPYY